MSGIDRDERKDALAVRRDGGVNAGDAALDGGIGVSVGVVAAVWSGLSWATAIRGQRKLEQAKREMADGQFKRARQRLSELADRRSSAPSRPISLESAKRPLATLTPRRRCGPRFLRPHHSQSGLPSVGRGT